MPRETRDLLDADQQSAVAEGLAAGCADAWAQLYDAYVEDVWRYAARLVGGDRHAVADVVQETMLAAARSARTFDPDRGALPAWLMGIAQRQAALYLRRAQRTPLAGTNHGEQTARGDEASQALLRREQADHVRRVLADLPADAAWLLVTKYVDGESIAALATRTGAGLEAVRSKLARARRLFRQALSRAPRPVEAMRKASDD